jgi:hypothetical protein
MCVGPYSLECKLFYNMEGISDDVNKTGKLIG